MPEPLIRSAHLVGSWDGDAHGWSVRDFTAGPAGSAGVTLPGGVELDVDVAAPSTLTNLWVPADDERTPSQDAGETLKVLLGPERASALLALRRDPPRVLPGGREFRESIQRHGTLRGRDAGVDRRLAQLSLASDDASATSPLTRALVEVDALAAAFALGNELRLDEATERRAAAVVRELSRLADDGELDGQPIPASALISALRQIGERLDQRGRALLEALLIDIGEGEYELLTEMDHELPGRAVSAPMPYAAEPLPPAAAAPIVDVVDHRTLPETFRHDQVAARATTRSEIELRVHGRAGDAEGWWARAITPDDVVVAAAPLRAHEGDAIARLLVPPAVLATVVVDIAGNPGETRIPAGLRAVSDAVAVGRSAARAERLEDRRQSRRRWQAAAEAWSQAGDQARAGLAAEYSTGRSRERGADRDRVPPPLLADAVIESGG